MRIFSLLSTLLASAGLGGVLFFLFYFSLPLFRYDAFAALLTTHWNPDVGQYGLLPMVAGTLSVALLATAVGFVGALAVALHWEGMHPGWLQTLLYRAAMVAGAIPTVVYGLVGVLILVPWLRGYLTGGSGWSILAAGVMLSLVIWPTMVLFLIDTFRGTPAEFAAITAALGGERVQYQLAIMLPLHRHNIGIALSLGLARAMGDTMIALMLAGNSIQMPGSLLDSVRTLPAHIALLFAGDFDSPAFRSIFVSGLILMGLSVFLLGVIGMLRRREIL